MTLCPNTKGGQCCCQPQDGVMCPYGPTPNDWKPWPLPPKPEPIYAPPGGYTAEQLDAYALADRAASAPQAVRMPLPEKQLYAMWDDYSFAGLSGQTSHRWLDFARAIEAAHGIVPLAPQDSTKEGNSK